MENNLSPKEKFDLKDKNRVGRLMLEELIYGRGTIKEFSEHRGIDEKRVVQMLNVEAKKLIQRKDWENQKFKEKEK